MSDYRKILDDSIAIHRILSSRRFDGVLLTDTLQIPNIDISLWHIYEVILTIHCFPRLNRSILRTYVYGFIKQISYSIRRNLYFRNYCGSEIKKLESANNILFLSFTAYLAKENFVPVCDLLNRDGVLNPIIITEGSVFDFGVAEQCKVNINQLNNTQIESMRTEIRVSIKRLLKDLRFKLKKMDADSAQLKAFRAAITFMHTYSDEIVPKYLAVAYYILLKFPPKALVSIDVADPRTRIFTLLANQLNIPVIQLQAGPINEDCVEWRFVYDNLVLAHGRRGQSALEEHGIPRDRILAVGSAKHEGVLAFGKQSSLVLRERFGIMQTTKIVVLLSSYTELLLTNPEFSKQIPIFEQMYDAIVCGISNRTSLALVIKPHPLEKIDKLNALAKMHERIYVTGSRENTSELIACADAVISFGSTSTLDAILLDKLTICPQFNGWMGEYFQNSGAVVVPKNVMDIERLLDLIDQNLTDDLMESVKTARLKFLQDVTTGMGSGATRRIVEQIYRVVAEP
jgi:hypothetical protein